MIPHSCAKWTRARPGRLGRGGRTFRGNCVERRSRRRKNAGACAGGNGGVVPHLLATNLRVSTPLRPQHTRRAGPDSIVFPARPRKRNTAARFAREGALSQFPPRGAEALSGRRTGAAAYFETRRRGTIHLHGRARSRGAAPITLRSRRCAGRNFGCSVGWRSAGARTRESALGV